MPYHLFLVAPDSFRSFLKLTDWNNSKSTHKRNLLSFFVVDIFDLATATAIATVFFDIFVFSSLFYWMRSKPYTHSRLTLLDSSYDMRSTTFLEFEYRHCRKMHVAEHFSPLIISSSSRLSAFWYIFFVLFVVCLFANHIRLLPIAFLSASFDLWFILVHCNDRPEPVIIW